MLSKSTIDILQYHYECICLHDGTCLNMDMSDFESLLLEIIAGQKYSCSEIEREIYQVLQRLKEDK